MRIVIMYNPVSGRGRSAHASETAKVALAARGHEVSCVASRLEPTAAWLDPAIAGANLLVVAGGDGAMRLAAPAAARSNVPVYHLPLGTENLFAREFGMNRDVRVLHAAIERWQVQRIDVGIANGRWFLLMASIGFDADVVHTLAASRGSSISHLTYIKPVLKTMRTWSPPRVSIEVDGQAIVNEQQGMIVIANSRQYGWRIDPAGRANMSDGLLDVVFMPAKSLAGVIGWVMRCRTRRQFNHRAIVATSGKRVDIRCNEPQHYQLDGDPPGIVKELLPEGFEAAGMDSDDDASAARRLHCSICPAHLQVLTASRGP